MLRPTASSPARTKNSVVEAKQEDQRALQSWASHEEKEQSKRLLQEQQAEENPSRHPFHNTVLLLRCIASLSAVLMLIGQIVGLVVDQKETIVTYALRAYVVLFCVGVLRIERLEKSFFSWWMIRGLYYVFIGLLGLQQNESLSSGSSSTAKRQYLKVVAWIMVSIGSVYAAMGATCFLELYYRSLVTDFEERQSRSHAVRQTRQRYYASWLRGDGAV